MAQKVNPNLLAQLERKRESLAGSSSGWSYTGEPASRSDASREASLMKLDEQIEGVKSKLAAEKWYGTGDEKEDSNTPKLGAFTRFMHAVNTPLYGVVGGIKGALGMNKGKGILESAWENADWTRPVANLDDRQTVGDVLREAGVSNKIAAPVGFMGDLMLDPVNWFTAGLGGALIPRMVGGLVKGTVKGGLKTGLKAAAKGFTSRTGEMVARGIDMTKYIPGLRGGLKSALTGTTKKGLKIAGSDWAAKLSTDVINEYNDFNKLIGRNPLADMKAAATGSRVKFGSMLSSAVEDFVPGGKDFMDTFRYSPQRFAAASDATRNVPGLYEKVEAFANAADVTGKSKAKAELVDFLIDNRDNVYKGGLAKMPNPNVKSQLQSGYEKITGFLNESDSIANTAGGAILDAQQRGDAMLSVTRETMEDLANTLTEVRKIKQGETGVQWYDKISRKTQEWIKDTFKFDGQIRSDQLNKIDEAIDTAKAKGLIPAEDIANLDRWSMEVKEADRLKDLVKKRDLSPEELKRFEELTSGTTAAEKILNYKSQYGRERMTTGETFIRAIDFMTDLFKMAQVATSPAAVMNAIIGNPTMAMAAGIKLDPAYLSSLGDAFELAKGKGTPDLVWKLFFSNDDFLRAFAKNDTKLQMATGISLDNITRDFLLNSSVSAGKKSGLLKATTDAEIFEAYKAMKSDILEIAKKYEAGLAGRAVSKEGRAVTEAVGEATTKFKEVVDTAWTKRKSLDNFNSGTSWIKNEISSNESFLREVKDYVRKRAAEGSTFHKVMDLGVNKMASVFEGVDQTFKMGLALKLTNYGLSETEMRIASKTYPALLDAVTKIAPGVGGQKYFINWDKAIDFANEVYMNYAAMPPAVRMLRSIPLLNSPFVSFSYAMLPKFGKAVVHNPAFFNKIDFFKKEFEGQKSPLERKALESKYSEMYNAPGMVRLPDLPFLSKYPIYLNITNWVPFMGMNILDASNRKYSEDLLGKSAQMIDKLGLMQNPIGQVLKDTIIFPAIMGQEFENQGYYGQKRWPDEATAMEKIGYTVKDFVGSYIPKTVSMAAAPFIPEEIAGVSTIDKLPDYLGNLVGAMKGKSKKGVIKKDKNLLKTLTYLRGAGIQLYPQNLDYEKNISNKK